MAEAVCDAAAPLQDLRADVAAVSHNHISASSQLSSASSSDKAASDTTADTSVRDTEGSNAGSHEHLSQSEAVAPGASNTDDATKSSDKEKDKVDILVDKPGYHKELRTTAKGRKYLIETRGLWTTLRSLTPLSKNRSVKHRLTKRILDFTTFWPFLLRFAKEVINLGRWRFLLHLTASTLTGLAPALRIYLSGRLIAIAQEASEKRTLRKAELFWIAASSYISSYLETWVDELLANNNGILQRRFQAMVSEHLISARARLDVHTLNKTRVSRDFASAASLVHALGDGNFVIGQLIDLFTSTVSLTTQASMLWKMTTKDNADLALISVFSSSLTMMRWFWRGRRGYTMTAITDKNYNRMTLMEDMSHPDSYTFGERKVLGLGDWVYDQYKKASSALGDVSLAQPRFMDPLTTATEAIKSFTDTAIIVVFAIKAAEQPVGQAALSMSSLSFIQSATRNLASSIYRFVFDLQHFGDELSAFKSYYRVLEIKSAIKEPEDPRIYTTLHRSIESEDADGVKTSVERYGMEIEFIDVCYTWPGRKEKALDHISFKINAGELTAIVGYNGGGKSTIIALIARLCEPSSGEILINGHNIRSYKTSDLHQAMSFLFQSSADLPLTIQEYIGVGNLGEINNLQKIRQAATDSGAVEFIDKLPDGFQSSFTGHVETETPETLYKDAVAWDSYLDNAHDEGDDDEEEEEDDNDKDDTSKDKDNSKVDTVKELHSVDGKQESTCQESKGAGPAEQPASTTEVKTEHNTKEEKQQEIKAEVKQDEDDSKTDGIKSKKTKVGSDNNSDSDSDSDSDSGDSQSEGRLAFSGGQRQKLILARTFLRDKCDLAIFDEYSANLDPLAEHSLFQKITAKRGKQTLLYITHRYSTVRHADRILMVEKGKVIECGTHDELMAIDNGKYAEMSRLALGETDFDKKKKDSSASSHPDSAEPRDRTFSADEETAINTQLPLSPLIAPQAL